MEKDSRNSGASSEGWRNSGNSEADSSHDKDKKSKKKKSFRVPLGGHADSDVAASKTQESTDEAPTESADKSTAVAAWKRLVAKNTEKPLEDNIETADDHDDLQVENKTMNFPMTEVAETAEAAQPPVVPPPVSNWLRGPELALEGAGSNWSAETSSDDFESRAANAPLSVPETPNIENAESAPNDDEADPEVEMVAQNMPLPNVNKTEKLSSLPPERRPAEVVSRPNQPRNGFERNVGDVQRAAWTGIVFGWLVGRRGKKKAVERAISATKQRYQRTPQPKAYNTAPAATSAEAPTASQTTEPVKTAADWLRPENSSAAARRVSSEHLSSTPLADMLAVPAAVVAARMLTERRNARQEAALDDTQLVELAKTIKVDGIPLHKIYESKQIDKGGLRAVVAAYLRGESVEKHLTQQIVEKQKSFERDPRQRYRAAVSSGLRSAVGNVSGALAATGAGLAHGSQQVAGKVASTVGNIGNRNNGGATPAGRPAPKPATIVSNGSGTNWLSVIAIVIIYGLILILWITRPR